MSAGGGEIDIVAAGARPGGAAAFAPPRYHKISHDREAIAELFVTLFQPHSRPPKRIILDRGATDSCGASTSMRRQVHVRRCADPLALSEGADLPSC